jgi:hypothetical protein
LSSCSVTNVDPTETLYAREAEQTDAPERQSRPCRQWRTNRRRPVIGDVLRQVERNHMRDSTITESEWLASNDPEDMYFRGWTVVRASSHRRMDLFCVACARLVCHLMDDEGARRAFMWLEANPGQRERPTGPGSVLDLFRGVGRALYEAHHRREGGVSGAATHIAYDFWADWYEYAFPNVRDYFAGTPEVLRVDPRMYLPTVMRDIFPFGTVSINPAWVTPEVLALCREMYESQNFAAMPTLAHALKEAGCDNQPILAHCMTDGGHVRGCWVVDLVLGKQ